MMNDMLCAYEGRREEVLVSYLYDDIDPAERDEFAAHLAACAVCRSELQALTHIRAGLAGWMAPDVADGVGGAAPRSTLKLVAPQRVRGWRVADLPVWAQAAAAMLVVAASLGLANLDVSYSRDGLHITTGWMRHASASSTTATVTAVPPVSSPWRPDLSALERQLRQDLGPRPAPVAVPVPPPNDEAVMKRVRSLIEESERRQQRELALRVAEVARDVQVQRQADLVRIDRTLGLMQNRTGVEVMRTQQQLNTLAQRVSEQR
jgi:hypothetical protein